MQQAALAARFDEVGAGLAEDGHLIIVRKARAFLEAGDLDGARAFLDRAADYVPAATPLAEGLRSWADAGGVLDELVTDPGWVERGARDERAARFIGSVARGDLRVLGAALADQQRGLATGDALPAVPSAQMAPEEMPPLPSTKPAAQPLASILPDRAERPKAAVEAPSRLTEKPLDLDSMVPAEAPPAAAAPEAVAAAPMASRSSGVITGQGDSSTTFWCRRCTEQSRSPRWITLP